MPAAELRLSFYGHPAPGGGLSPLPAPISAPGIKGLRECPYGKEGWRWPAHCRNVPTMQPGRALLSDDRRDGTHASYTSHCTQKSTQKWIKALEVRPETVKLLEDIRCKLLDIGFGNDFFFLDLTSKAKINKWDYIKLKGLLHSKENNQQSEKASYGPGESICKSYI